MTLFFHEMRRSRLSLIIWSAALSYMLLICVVIYPEMKSQMGELGDMFADMGAFSEGGTITDTIMTVVLLVISFSLVNMFDSIATEYVGPAKDIMVDKRTV